jgi:flavin-dependent dehydrogenase
VAIELQRFGRSVILVEASHYDRVRVGESVPPTIKGLLETLDAEQMVGEAYALPSHGSDASWGSEILNHEDYLTHQHGLGYHLDRQRFDAGLFELVAQTSVCALIGYRATNITRVLGGWQIELKSGGSDPRSVQAQFVVDCTGRQAFLSQKLGAVQQRFDALVAVVARFQTSISIPLRVVTEATSGGWWYAAPVPGSEIVVAWLSDADLLKADGVGQKAAWFEALKRTKYIAPLLTHAELSQDFHRFAADSRLLRPGYGSDWLAVGDAGACFDPLSSTGILEALRSGKMAGRAIQSHLTGDESALKHFDVERCHNYETYLIERHKVYGQETRFRNATFWRRRAAPINLSPDTRLTLAPGVLSLQHTIGSPLSAVEREAIVASCGQPCTASELVRHLVRIGHWKRDQVRLILGLQDLVERGLLV